MSPERRRHWIPPAALVGGQLAHGVSWVLLLLLASRGPLEFGFPALAWLHLVVLGWLTMTALAVLVHVIPSFTDVPWKGERVARGALALYGTSVVALVVAFWTRSIAALPWAGALVALSLAVYLIPAGRTLAAAFSAAPREATIARALSVALTSLFVTALIGVGLALALGGHAPTFLLSGGAPIHGSFGIIGWLTVLVMGVSTRTVRPITGASSRWPAAHVAAGTLQFGGLAAFVVGSATAPVLEWSGLIAIFIGALFYVGDLVDILRRATVSHRPPQAFLLAGALWLIVGVALSTSVLAGAPYGPAAVYVLVAGWIAQMVNGNLYHIGIRLIATMARGDDDDTRPGDLLVPSLSWASFTLFQGAVAGGAFALALGVPQGLAAAALAGFAGWMTMVANIVVAARRAARREPGLKK